MESNWYRLARYVELNNNAYVNDFDRYFECPYCGELIYETDWRDTDYWLGKNYNKQWYCPICEDLLGKF
jgi:rubredoxin